MRPEADQGKSVGGDSGVKTPEGGRNKRTWRGGDRDRERIRIQRFSSGRLHVSLQINRFFFFFP